MGIQQEPDLGIIQPQAPSPHAFFQHAVRSTGMLYWGSGPTSHLSKSSKGTCLTRLATRCSTRPGTTPLFHRPAALSPSLSLTLPVPLAVLPPSLVHVAVRPGKLACSSKRVTHHSSVQVVKHKATTVPTMVQESQIPASANLHDRDSEGKVQGTQGTAPALGPEFRQRPVSQKLGLAGPIQ